MDLASYLQGAEDALGPPARFCASEAAIPGCLAQLRPQLCRALGITRFEDFPQPRGPGEERYSGVVADYSGAGRVELQTQASGHGAILVAFINNTNALLAQNAALRERRDQLEEEAARLRSGMRAAAARNTEDRGSFDREARAYEAELAQQRRGERQLREALEAARASCDEGARAYADLSQRHQALEAALRRSELECETLRDRLRSAYGMDGGVGGAGDLVLAALAGRGPEGAGGAFGQPGPQGTSSAGSAPGGPSRLSDAALARSALFLNAADQLVEFYDDLGLLLREMAGGDGGEAGEGAGAGEGRERGEGGVEGVEGAGERGGAKQGVRGRSGPGTGPAAGPNAGPAAAPDPAAALRATIRAALRASPDYRAELSRLKAASLGPAPAPARRPALRPGELMGGLIDGVKARFGLVLSKAQRDAEGYRQAISALQDVVAAQDGAIARFLGAPGAPGTPSAARAAPGAAPGAAARAAGPAALPASAPVSVLSTPAIPGDELRPPIRIVSPVSPPPAQPGDPGRPGPAQLLALAASMDSLKRENTDLRRALEISGAGRQPA